MEERKGKIQERNTLIFHFRPVCKCSISCSLKVAPDTAGVCERRGKTFNMLLVVEQGEIKFYWCYGWIASNLLVLDYKTMRILLRIFRSCSGLHIVIICSMIGLYNIIIAFKRAAILNSNSVIPKSEEPSASEGGARCHSILLPRSAAARRHS